jgi:hypothetical protein
MQISFGQQSQGSSLDEIMKRLVIAVLISTMFGGIFTPPANAAYTVKPKVGQCFLYSVADVSAPYARKNPISCSSTHNAETYLVTKWPLKMKPEEMSDEEALSLADSLCRAWGDDGLIANPFFTYWAWYTPDPAAWAKGERWLRCDAMAKNKAEKYISWKGQRLYTGVNV